MKTRTWIVTGAGALASAGTVLAAPPPEPAAHEGSLKTIMVDLGQQMARVQTALWVEDLEAVSEAATQIADPAAELRHPDCFCRPRFAAPPPAA